ncbi:hypothetical protein HWB76_gp101 [Streptomyces phage Blueeyedbeauty]|uniref:KTSC domain-containing protein n=1 Tax=Streptomyces phage Blueeyedbeauty TaxID=2250336 RepID=A0A345L1Z8_9CAUD|nr:hypothetical protein HWB76_gp101 [Streptomyces phage Blueeyedbeauty]AXH49300.1 hypothetical protein SEA_BLUEEYEDBEAUTY_192 [Streptomyces phage Blueeyedbeauty]
MKTTRFEYTHKTEVDSSLAQAVYYNENDQTMAIEFHELSYAYAGSAIYGEVPKAFYEGFVTVDSIGKTYNGFVKKTFPNIVQGTVYDVEYVDLNEVSAPISDQKEASHRYMVKGYVRHSGTFTAGNLEEARELFLDSLTEDGYDGSDLAVTEVYIVE